MTGLSAPNPVSAVPEKLGWPPVIVAPLAGVDSVTDGAGATSVMAKVTLVSVQAGDTATTGTAAASVIRSFGCTETVVDCDPLLPLPLRSTLAPCMSVQSALGHTPRGVAVWSAVVDHVTVTLPASGEVQATVAGWPSWGSSTA